MNLYAEWRGKIFTQLYSSQQNVKLPTKVKKHQLRIIQMPFKLILMLLIKKSWSHDIHTFQVST